MSCYVSGWDRTPGESAPVQDRSATRADGLSLGLTLHESDYNGRHNKTVQHCSRLMPAGSTRVIPDVVDINMRLVVGDGSWYPDSQRCHKSCLS